MRPGASSVTSGCSRSAAPISSAFARDLEARGRARATITRRLCTNAGFYKYAVEEDLLEHSPAAHVRRPRLDYESHATGWTATSSARCWWPPGSASLPSTH
jgi:site-specific recombinase XerD